MTTRTIELDWPGHPAHGRRRTIKGRRIGLLWSDVPWSQWTADDPLWMVTVAPTGQRTPDGQADIVAPCPPLP